jgi:hypothetical protein
MFLSDAGNGQPMTGFPTVGLLSCAAVLCSIVLAGRVRLEDEAGAASLAGMDEAQPLQGDSSLDSPTNPEAIADDLLEWSGPKA